MRPNHGSSAVDSDLLATWQERFGPVQRIGSHAGVSVFRLLEPPGAIAVLKLHQDRGRAEREIALLEAELAFAAPELQSVEDLGAHGILLSMADARAGRDARQDRLATEQLPACAALVAKLHGHPPPKILGSPLGAGLDTTAVRRRAAAPNISRGVREAVVNLLLFNDALCHHDLHPSNWLTSGGRPLGLLDFAAVGRGDPESDLAGILLAGGGDVAPLNAVCDAWEEAMQGRLSDRPRVALYLSLALEEHAATKPDERAAQYRQLALQAQAYRQGRPCHGALDTPRLVHKPEGPDRWMPVTTPEAESIGALLGREEVCERQPGDPIDTYVPHACNDILRIHTDRGQRVLKVYNKPVWPHLFELEQLLAQQLADTPAAVLAPLPTGRGATRFRCGPRPAALYPYVGDRRLGTGRRSLALLAAAQAALHTVQIEHQRFGGLQQDLEQIPLDRILSRATGLVDEESWQQLRAAGQWARRQLAEALPELPRALVHGSLCRDHVGWSDKHGVVLFDLEKVRWAPRLYDVARTAYFAGYRSNDEQLDPTRMVHYLREYHRQTGLMPAEVQVAVAFLMDSFLHDIDAMAQEGCSEAVLGRHARLTLEFYDNRDNLRQALTRYLAPDSASQPGRDNPNRTRGLIRLTMACNERCLFCNEPFERYRQATASADAIEQQLERFAQTHQDTLTISGGEPTLERRALLELISAARERNIPFVVLQTNGVLIDDDYARALARAGLTEGFVSLLSEDPALHDALMGRPSTHARCLRGIDALINAGVSVTLNPVFAKTTQRTVPDYFSFVAGRLPDVRAVSVSAVQPHGRAERDLELLPDYAELGPAIREALPLADRYGVKAINPYCGVPLCVGWEHHPERCTDGLEALSGGFQKTPGIHNQGEKSHGPPCRECAWRPRCGGAWHAYWSVRQGSGIHAPGLRMAPWLGGARRAEAQVIVAAPGGANAATWSGLDGSTRPTVWCWTDQLHPGDAVRLAASPCTDLALDLSVRSVAAARGTLSQLRELAQCDSREIGAIQTQITLALRASGGADAQTLVSAVALAAGLGVHAVRLLAPDPDKWAALMADLRTRHPELDLDVGPPARALQSTITAD